MLKEIGLSVIAVIATVVLMVWFSFINEINPSRDVFDFVAVTALIFSIRNSFERF
jgi:hypothetical protein